MGDIKKKLVSVQPPARTQSDYQNPGNYRESDFPFYDKGDNQQGSGKVSFFGSSDGSNTDTEKGRKQVKDSGHSKPTL